ncbi:hypothetical protein E4U56_003325 [Claviceps arundinis]|uniref:2EXR domain-containing protein n=1 Tax=Claviceps arundinis TaxID=1623583 RepID=A0A9P7MXI9_9HYPO|nr:hypothetical protein E4U56_003325 [Claviceps arundinis]
MRSDDPDSSDDASTSSSSSDSNNSIRNHNSLIDDEAEESGEESSSGHDSRNGDAAPRPAFPQFMQLPPELRHQIWHLYCPDLSAKARVLQFSVGPSSAILQRPDHYSVKDHFSLADQTESLRVMLSMNSESRSIALGKYPDELIMDAGSGNAIVRFRKETDVVILTDWKPHRKYFLPGFADQVESVSVNQMECYREELGIDDELDSYDGMVLKVVPAMKDLFPNLKRLYTLWPGLFQSTDLMEEWCETDFVHTYMVETHERESGLGEDTKSLFCWPDLDEYAEFTDHIPRVCSPEKIKDSGLEVWPLVEFESQSGIKIYEKMRRLYFNPPLYPDLKVRYSDDPTTDSSHITLDDSDSNADGTDLNEYESEGIDDEEIIEIEGSSEDELLQGEPGRFSSPESDDVEVLAEVNTEPVEHVEPVPRSRKRKAIVVDSDDDEEAMEEKGSDDEGDRRQNKRARLTCLVLDSDDEEDGERDDVQHDQNEAEAISTRRAPKSSRVMLSSSDDQSDNDGDIDEEDTRRAPIALDSDSEEEDDEDEDEDVAPKKLPLAELLRRARPENIISSASEGDSGQTDEESESEEDQSNNDDDDEDENEHGLLDTMAGDGTEDEEDEDENEDGW